MVHRRAGRQGRRGVHLHRRAARGQETTLFSIITNLLHFGCTVVGLDYGFKGQNGVDVVRGGSPYGATTIANNDGSRLPSEIDLDGARYLGRRVAETAAKLMA